jgi:hypothetical protein
MESNGDITPSEQYLSGPKLFTLLSSLTLVTFLVCLDTSIMGTVHATYILYMRTQS